MTSDDESDWIIINPNNKKNIVFRQPVNIVPTITTCSEIQPFIDEAKTYFNEADMRLNDTENENVNIVQEVDTDKSSEETHIINTRDDIMADLILESTVPFKKSIVSRYKKDVYAFDAFRNIPIVLFNKGRQLYKSENLSKIVIKQSATSFIIKRGLKVSFIILKW